MANKHSAEHLSEYKWAKGQSGNPKGRPKGTLSLTTQLKAYLADNPLRVRKLIEALYVMAVTGNYQAMAEIFNRVDGRVVEKHEIEGQLPIKLVFKPIVKETMELEGQAIDGEYKVLDEPEPS
jgi:hypothetical protein